MGKKEKRERELLGSRKEAFLRHKMYRHVMEHLGGYH